jgi:putative ABC transport system permease protein
VVEDFNYTSLKQNIEPLVIAPNPGRHLALVRLKPGNLAKSIEAVKDAYARAAPAYPCEYTFLDQNFDRLYSKDLRQQNVLSIFSGLAILIACLGLFGLTSFTTARRTREIGIRKVLGSSVQNIILLLSKELLRPVLLATLIAIPVAYGVMHSWLQDFAYRTGMQWWIFVLSAFITVAIALCTVTFKAVKAAVANPTKSLRSE